MESGCLLSRILSFLSQMVAAMVQDQVKIEAGGSPDSVTASILIVCSKLCSAAVNLQ